MIDIGANIRYLRKMHEETQSQLADALGVGYSNRMISKYENGRPIDLETLNKIATHYCLTADDLIFHDCSDFSLPGISFTHTIFIKTIETLFPLTPPNTEDPLFNRGYTLTKEFFAAMSHINDDLNVTSYINQLYEAIDYFKQSIDKYNNLESNANFVVVSLMLWMYLYGDNVNSPNTSKNTFFNICIPSQVVTKYSSLLLSQTLNDWSYDQLKFYQEKNEDINNCLRILKKSRYSDLADYCMYLKYLVCLNATYSGIECRKISKEMYAILDIFENPYVLNIDTNFQDILE